MRGLLKKGPDTFYENLLLHENRDLPPPPRFRDVLEEVRETPCRGLLISISTTRI